MQSLVWIGWLLQLGTSFGGVPRNPGAQSDVAVVSPLQATGADISQTENEAETADPRLVRSRFSLMTAEREALYRRLLPRVSDKEVAAALASQDLLLYTDYEMPQAYQFWDGQFPGIHSPDYNVSANGSEPIGNGNREFPWNAPAGTHRAPGVRSLHFVLLPRDDQSRLLPIVWYRKPLSGDGATGYGWTFPTGALVGEILSLRGPDGRDYPFEMRVRRRERAHWEVDAFRPFPTSSSLSERIKELRPDWEARPNLARFCRYLDEPQELPIRTLADSQPMLRAFAQRMGVDTLPALEDDALVAELLQQTTFQSATGQSWRDGKNQTVTFAPTTLASFHVVPANYDAGFVAVDSKSCRRCHETANQSVRDFDAGRDWYGRIRGSDGIFSFHPFSPDSISDNGFPRGVRMRSELERAGMLERFDAKRHFHALYQRIDGSRE